MIIFSVIRIHPLVQFCYCLCRLNYSSSNRNFDWGPIIRKISHNLHRWTRYSDFAFSDLFPKLKILAPRRFSAEMSLFISQKPTTQCDRMQHNSHWVNAQKWSEWPSDPTSPKASSINNLLRVPWLASAFFLLNSLAYKGSLIMHSLCAIRSLLVKCWRKFQWMLRILEGIRLMMVSKPNKNKERRLARIHVTHIDQLIGWIVNGR